MLSCLGKFVEMICWESYISANCQFFLLITHLARFVVILESVCIWLLPFRLSTGSPRWRLAWYLSCNMRRSGCSEPESIISPPVISTTDSRSPPPHTLLNAQTWRGGREKRNALIHVMEANASLFMAVAVWYLEADGREQWRLNRP